MYEFLWVTLTHQYVESHHDFTPLRLSFDLLLIFSLNLLPFPKRQRRRRRQRYSSHKKIL